MPTEASSNAGRDARSLPALRLRRNFPAKKPRGPDAQGRGGVLTEVMFSMICVMCLESLVVRWFVEELFELS